VDHLLRQLAAQANAGRAKPKELVKPMWH
jgi:hypothetical protein